MTLHECEWTEEKISEFDKNINTLIENKKKANNYFSQQSGEYLIGLFNKIYSLKNKKILDYACGEGDLINAALKGDYKMDSIYGFDLAPSSIDVANKKNIGFSKFGGDCPKTRT